MTQNIQCLNKWKTRHKKGNKICSWTVGNTTDHDYYNFEHLNSYNSLVKIVISCRGLGKTYGKLKDLILRVLKTEDERILYLVENEPQLKELCANTGLKFIAQLVDYIDQDRIKFNDKMVFVDDIPRIQLFDLAHYGQAKRVAGGNIRYVIFDEIIELSSRANRFNIVEAFGSVVQSFIRTKKCEIWGFGNTENPNSPFVKLLHLHRSDLFGKYYTIRQEYLDEGVKKTYNITVHFVNAEHEYPKYYKKYINSSSGMLSSWLGDNLKNGEFSLVDKSKLYYKDCEPTQTFNYNGMVFGWTRFKEGKIYIMKLDNVTSKWALTNKDKGIYYKPLLDKFIIAELLDMVKYRDTFVYSTFKEIFKM